MRQLTDHMVRPDEQLTIDVIDEPGPGGASHIYGINAGSGSIDIFFQKGPIQETGDRGVTHEALLAILIDRLRCFQQGPYSCRENAIALTHLEEALMWLHKRTRDRIARGVEGTSEK